MPRRALVITLIALFSLGLLSVSPAFSLTDEEITALRLEISELRNQIQRAKDDIRFMSDVAKEDLRRADRTMDRLQEEMRAALQTARTDADRASRDAAWAKDFSNISLTALTITGIIVGIVTLFSLVFTWVYTRRIRDHTEEAKEFRDLAEKSMEKTEGYMERAARVTIQLEERREDIEKSIKEQVGHAVGTIKAEVDKAVRAEVERAIEDLDRREKEAVEAIDEKRDQAAEFNQFFMEGFRKFEQGNYKASLKAYAQALEIDNQSTIAWTNKGVALGGLGRNEEALKAHEKAIELNPKYAFAWYNKACAHSKLGQKQDMLDALRRAIDLDSEWKEEAKTDPDFEPYRDDPDFRALVFGEDLPSKETRQG